MRSTIVLVIIISALIKGSAWGQGVHIQDLSGAEVTAPITTATNFLVNLTQQKLPASKHLSAKTLLVINDPSAPNPVTPHLPDLDERVTVIYLSCTSNDYWAQWVYQMSHELVHLSVDGNSKPNATLIEEALCELYSEMALFDLARMSEDSHDTLLQRYTDNFAIYAAENWKRQAMAYKKAYSRTSHADRLALLRSLGEAESRPFNWHIGQLLKPFVDNDGLAALMPLSVINPEAIINPERYLTDLEKLPTVIQNAVWYLHYYL